MTGLDCNILVQLAFAEHPANAATIIAVQAEAGRSGSLGLAPLTVSEFLHVATDPRRFAPPLDMVEALDWVEQFMANPGIVLLEPGPNALRQALSWMRQFRLGRKRILDAYLAASLLAAGATRLVTANPADFTVFGNLELITPGRST